jgi:hypothetical protein
MITTDRIALAATALDALPAREAPLLVSDALARLAPQLEGLRRRGYTMQDAATAASQALGCQISPRQLERALRAAKSPRRTAVRTAKKCRPERAAAPSSGCGALPHVTDQDQQRP